MGGWYLDATFGLAYVLLLVGIGLSRLLAVRVIRRSAGKSCNEWRGHSMSYHGNSSDLTGTDTYKLAASVITHTTWSLNHLLCKLVSYNNIQLTLLAPSGPGGILHWRPFGRGLWPWGDGLDRPRLFGWQPLQTDMPLLKHLLDILQSLQCLQDTGLQAQSSVSIALLIIFVTEYQNLNICVLHTLISSDRTTSYWLWRFLSSVSWFFSAESRKDSMSVSADSAPSWDWHLSTAWEASR